MERKAALLDLLAGAGKAIRPGDHIEGDGEDFYRQACNFALEGIISKRADLPYHAGRKRSGSR